jgi:hypothetical protein
MIRFHVNKTNRCTEFQLYYWYYKSTCFGQSFCPSSGASQPYNGIGTIYAARWPSATRIRTDPGSTRSPSCINCTNATVWLRSSWWWAERLPKTCTVIISIIKLELSASVGFIHKVGVIIQLTIHRRQHWLESLCRLRHTFSLQTMWLPRVQSRSSHFVSSLLYLLGACPFRTTSQNQVYIHHPITINVYPLDGWNYFLLYEEVCLNDNYHAPFHAG